MMKMFVAGVAMIAALASCNRTGSTPQELTRLTRDMFVVTSDPTNPSQAPKASIVKAGIEWDFYNNTTATLTLNNVAMPNGSTSVITATPLKYVVGNLGYQFTPLSETAYTGIGADTENLFLFMGGVNMINCRMMIEGPKTKVLGYSRALYLFSSAMVSDGTNTFTTADPTKNVIQVLISNSSTDNSFTATIYWVKPVFNSQMSATEFVQVLALSGLNVNLDPATKMLRITSPAGTTVIPRKAEVGSATLGEPINNYKMTNINMLIGDIVNNAGNVEFEFDYTAPVASADITPVTVHYTFNGSLTANPNFNE